MLVSVIVPVYNIPDNLLRKCIDSVLSQTHQELEIIIINDCSPLIENALFLRELSHKDARVKYLELRENGGVSNARNIGLTNATGEWVCFVDADDNLCTNSIEILLNAAVASCSDIVIGRILYNGSVDTPLLPCNVREIKIINEHDALAAINMCQLSLCGKLFRREVFENIQFPVGIAHFEDAVVMWTIISKNTCFACINEICYITNYRHESASHGYIDKHKHLKIIRDLRYVSGKMRDLFKTMPKVLHFLSCVIVRESFVNRKLYTNLKKEDANFVKKDNLLLLQELNEIGKLTSFFVWIIKFRIFALGTPLTGYPSILYYPIRLIYRLESLLFRICSNSSSGFIR